MSLRRSFAATMAACALAFASPAVAATPWGLAPGDFYSELSGSFYSSKDFFNDAKKREQFGGTLEERVVRSHNEFGWRKWATLTLDLPFVSRSFIPQSGLASTSTGFGDIGLGVRIPIQAWWKTPTSIGLGWTAPLGTNRALFPGTSGSGGMNGGLLRSRSGIPLQDTSTFFSQGLQSLFTQLEVGGSMGSRTFWTLGVGQRLTYLALGDLSKGKVTIYFNGDSTSARRARDAMFTTGSASLGVWATNSLLITGAVEGEWQSDEGSQYDRLGNLVELQSNRVLAGARLTYRVDERMDVFAGSWHTPSGRNVVHHDLFYCGIAWKHSGLDRLAGALGGTKAR